MSFILCLLIYCIKSLDNDVIEKGPLQSDGQTPKTTCGHTDISPGTASIVIRTADDPYQYCQNLQSKTFTFDSGVTSVGEYFFYRSNVETVTLSTGITSIGRGAFAFCPFLKLSIPSHPANTYLNIGEGAFYKSALTVTSMPAEGLNIDTFGSHAFYSCNKITSLTVNLYCNVPESAFEHFGISSTGQNTLTVSLKRKPSATAFYTIGANAFAYSSITKFTIENYITEVGEYAFAFSKLNQFDFKTDYKTTQTISEGAFYNCNFGTSAIVIPETVKTINAHAFANCILDSVTIRGNSAGTEILEAAFYGCTMKTLIFGDFPSTFKSSSFAKCQNIGTLNFGKIESIPEFAFQEDLITTDIKLTFPATITEIGEGAFKHCSAITEVTFEPNSQIETIENSLFYECTKLAKVSNLPNTITSIGKARKQSDPATLDPVGYSFYNCISLETFSWPSYITAIHPNSFMNCKNLKLINLPNTLTTIGESAFEGCTNLNTETDTPMVLSYAITNVGDRVFYGCSSLSCDVKILAGSVSTGMFYSCTNIKTLFIHRTIGTIEGKAFYKCTSLTNLVATGVTTISDQAFYGCSSLIGSIPSTVTTINQQAFYGCTNLVGPVPSTLSTISDEAFHGCSSLTGEIPSSLTTNELPKGVFYGCSSLTGEIPSSVTSVEAYALYGCRGLTGPVPSINSIEEYAFYGCSGLTGEIDASSITYVGRYAFAGCSRLTGPLYFASNVRIEDFAFQGCSGFSNSLSFDIDGTTPRTKIGRNAFQDCTGFKDGTLSFVINSKEDQINTQHLYYKFNYFLQICNNAFDNTKFKDIYYLGRFEPDCDYDIGISKIQGIHTSSNYANKSFCNHPLHSDDLSAGAIAGIVIACIVVVAAIAVLVVFLILRRRKNKPQSEEEYEMNQDP